ncbi:hypothetical protein DQY68_24765 [Salmonella enterica subsp. salamae]|nr:hypothetical protein [Salmonella enterica subsp. salamae]
MIRKYDRKKDGTWFYHFKNGNILCRLDATLNRYDRERLQILFNFIYYQRKAAGSEERTTEIRMAPRFEHAK